MKSARSQGREEERHARQRDIETSHLIGQTDCIYIIFGFVAQFKLLGRRIVWPLDEEYVKDPFLYWMGYALQHVCSGCDMG